MRLRKVRAMKRRTWPASRVTFARVGPLLSDPRQPLRRLPHAATLLSPRLRLLHGLTTTPCDAYFWLFCASDVMHIMSVQSKVQVQVGFFVRVLSMIVLLVVLHMGVITSFHIDFNLQVHFSSLQIHRCMFDSSQWEHDGKASSCCHACPFKLVWL